MASYSYWSWKNIFNKKQIKKINSFILKNFHSVESPETGAHDSQGRPLKSSSVKIIYWKQVKHLFSDLMDHINYANRAHFGYDLYPMSDVSGCNFNVYSEKNRGGYEWHYDESRSESSDIKLTIVVNLSDGKYEGGQLEMFRNQSMMVTELDEPGSVVMFRSPLSHRVSPVTKGERKTLVFFMVGPSFK